MNNRGSALLTVILVVGFLTILATTLLYVSGMNYIIKQADYQNKKNFYTGEVALEEIRANLMEDASWASVEAYNEIVRRYVHLGNKEARRLEYNKLFVEMLQKRWNEDKLPAVGGDWQALLSSYHSPGYDLKLEPGVDASGDPVNVLTINEGEGTIRINGLKVTYIDSQTKLATIISTDLDVRAPEINWDAEGTILTLPDEVTAEDAAKAAQTKTADASTCVKYANWKKE